MHFLSRLARALEQLRRAAYRYHDSDLKWAISELYRALATVINVVEKVYEIYLELDVLMKTDLRPDQCDLAEDMPFEGEGLTDYVRRLASAGRDPNKTLAYLLGAGLVRIEVSESGVYLRLLCEKAAHDVGRAGV